MIASAGVRSGPFGRTETLSFPPILTSPEEEDGIHFESSGFHSPGLEMPPPDADAISYGSPTVSHRPLTPPAEISKTSLGESRGSKRPAETQIPTDTEAPSSNSLEKRLATRLAADDHALLQARYEVVVDVNHQHEALIVSLRDEKDRMKKARDEERRQLVEEIQTLRYENMQMKVVVEDMAKRSKTSHVDKMKKMEGEMATLRSRLLQKDEEVRRMGSKLDKINDEYARLAETTILDPAENYPVQTVECTFRPISPPADDHECVNPGYSENCSVSNRDIHTTACQLAGYTAVETSGHSTALHREIIYSRQQEAPSVSSSWWSKAKTLSQKRPNKWVELPSLPGNMMDKCMGTEHSGRLYVAITVSSPARSHSPTPLPMIELLSCNERDRRWINHSIPSPSDAVHPTALLSHANHLYLVTAQDGGDSIWRLDTQLKCWTFLSATINGETACAACLVDGQIVLAGGARKDGAGTSCSVVTSFSIDTMSWNHGWPQLCTPRHAARLVVMDDSLFIIGGGVGSKTTGFDTMTSIERLSLSAVQEGWQEVGRTAQLAPAVAAVGKYIVCAGGLVRQPDLGPIDLVKCMSVDQSRLKSDSIAALNFRRSAASMVCYRNRLYCLGGCSDKWTYCGVVEELCLD